MVVTEVQLRLIGLLAGGKTIALDPRRGHYTCGNRVFGTATVDALRKRGIIVGSSLRPGLTMSSFATGCAGEAVRRIGEQILEALNEEMYIAELVRRLGGPLRPEVFEALTYLLGEHRVTKRSGMADGRKVSYYAKVAQ